MSRSNCNNDQRGGIIRAAKSFSIIASTKKYNVGYRADEAVKVDEKRQTRYSRDPADEFRGCLISIECGDDGYYQGIVHKVDPVKRTVTIRNPFKDGLPVGTKYLSLPNSLIYNLKILKMPNGDSPPKGTKNTQMEMKVSSPPINSIQQRKDTNGKIRGNKSISQPKRNSTAEMPSCSLFSRSFGGNYIGNGSSKAVLKKSSSEEKPRRSSTDIRISASELLISKPLPSRDASVALYRSRAKSNHSYTKFGEFKLFKEQQVPIPRVLQMNKSGCAKGPTGNPVIDCSTGYLRYSDKDGEFGEPIDFDALQTDFDFDKNLALFDKERISGDEFSGAEGRHSSPPYIVKSFRNDENVLKDDARVISWTKSASRLSQTTADGIIGKLISVNCNEGSQYQGKLESTDVESGTITIEWPYRNGIALEDRFVTLLASTMQDLKIYDVQPSVTNFGMTLATPAERNQVKKTKKTKGRSRSCLLK